MKHMWISLLTLLVGGAVVLAAGCKSAPQAILPSVQETLSFDRTNRQLGYQIIDNGSKVAFVFDQAAYKFESVSKVYLEGSFNGWLKGTDDSWLLSPSSNPKIWTLTRDAADIRIPGNSGYPEFKFYVIVKDPKFPQEPNAISTVPGFQMATNNLVLFPGDAPEEIAQNVVIANTLKTLDQFDLSDPAQVALISNVRQVPGTPALYRGYHPFKKSRGQYDTEEPRIALVKEALEKNGIKSVITLSGEEKAGGGESVSAYQQAIIAAGNQLYVNSSYNTVYYHSAEADFGNSVQTVVRFINSHPGPYYIHCRLGTDRTGTFSAVLAALCGTSWKDIAEDYQKTNLMGIKEFRDYHLLQYSFEKMLGKRMSEVGDLKAELSAYFIAGGYLTRADIDALNVKLGAVAK